MWRKIGIDHVRVFGGAKPPEATLEQAIGMAIETLKRGADTPVRAASSWGSKTTVGSQTSRKKRFKS